VRKAKTLMILTAAAIITAGCGGSNGSDSASGSPSSSQPSSVSPSDMPNDQAPPTRLVIDVTLKGGEVTPTNEQLQAAVKEQIVIRVNSDAADELHVHSTPEHTYKVEAKPMQSFQFTVDVPGKVDVELHQLGKTIATIQVQ
jgi:ABC-type glycerol-3-phosphate transport system substrate-binding protein